MALSLIGLLSTAVAEPSPVVDSLDDCPSEDDATTILDNLDGDCNGKLGQGSPQQKCSRRNEGYWLWRPFASLQCALVLELHDP